MNIEINNKLASRLKTISKIAKVPVSKLITQALEILADDGENVIESNKKAAKG